MALAAARRSPKAGMRDDMHPGCTSRWFARSGEKVGALGDGSPPVASSRIVFMGKSGRAGAWPGSQWGEGKIGSAAGSPPVGAASLARASQNWASLPPAALAVVREGTMARHSACVAGVMSSPAQAVGMRVPLLVQPGHVPRWAW